MNNLWKYTNGIGHLIMSLVGIATGLILILVPSSTQAQGVGIGMILAVQGYWFVSGSAKQVATEIINQMQAQPPTTSQPPSEITVKLPAVKKPSS